MLCNKCNTENDPDSKFCINCGEELESAVSNAATSQISATQPIVVQQSTQAEAASNPARKNAMIIVCVVACALLIALAVALVTYNAFKPNGFALDENNVADDVVRTTLSGKFDTNNDGNIDNDEFQAAQTIEVEGATDTSWIKEFTYAKSFTLKNSSVESIDLRDNKELTKIDVSGDNSLKTITLPDDPKIIDIQLPDREGINIVFPENSSMELQYVPTKVETPSGTYSQDVESATKVNSLSVPYSTYNFSYGSDGLLTNAIEKTQSTKPDTTTTFNWKNNLLTAETSVMSSYTNKYTCTYKNSSEYESVQADYSSSRADYTLSTSGLTTTMNYNANGTIMPYKVWTKDSSGKVVTFIEYGGNGYVYNKHDYTWNGDQLVSETVSSVTVEKDSWNFDNGTTSLRYSIDYSYTDGQLKKATYNTGATQEFAYKGSLLSSVNTTVPDSDTSGLKAGTTNITYKTVLGIKGKTALSFINLPGAATGGFVNKEPSAKLIELTDTYNGGYISRLQPSFNGQFWWNEQGIIDYQKTMAELKAQSSQTQNETQTDANDATKTNEEAYAAYKSTIEAVKTGQDGSSSSTSTSTNGILSTAKLDYGDGTMKVAYRDINDDGVDELFIGYECQFETDNQPIILAVYTYKNGSAANIITTGARYQSVLREDNTFYCQGSGGAAYTYYDVYKFDKDINLNASSSSRKDAPCATFIYSASYEDGKYYLDYQTNKTEVSKEEFDKYIAQMQSTSRAALDWQVC